MYKEKWVNNKVNLILNLLFVMHSIIKLQHQVVVVVQYIYGKEVVVIKVLKHMRVRFVHSLWTKQRNYYILVVWMVKWFHGDMKVVHQSRNKKLLILPQIHFSLLEQWLWIMSLRLNNGYLVQMELRYLLMMQLRNRQVQ